MKPSSVATDIAPELASQDSPSQTASRPDSSQVYTWRYILSVALEHKRALVLANVIAILAALASVPLPLLMPMMVDEVLLNDPGTIVAMVNPWFDESLHGPMLYIGVTLAFTILMRLMALVMNVLQARQFTIIAKDVIYRMRAGLLGHMQKVSIGEYETLGSGGIASHFVTDLDTIDRFVGTSISKLLIAGLSIIGTAIILFWMHWQLALLIMVLNPIVIYMTVMVGRKVKHLKRRENKAYEIFQEALTETLDAMVQVRVANREKYYLTHLTDLARGVRDHSVAYEWKNDAAGRLSFMVFLVGFDLFRATAMLMVVFSGLSIGQMMAVFGYLWFMMGPVQEVLNIQYAYYGAKAALKRVNSLQHLETEPEYPELQNPFAVAKQSSQTDETPRSVAIDLKDIHFAYQPDQPILNGVSLSIKAGQKVALVGASGGGKSTLVQVLLGLYQPQQGQVYIDGIDVQRIGLSQIRENVATVLQHPVLFNGTVRSNLEMGRSYTDDQLWQALAVAQLDDFIQAQPHGLESQVGRHGIRLSGGQRQRLAIARMVLTNPSVVILDEATSALDTETEAKLHQAMSSFLVGRTTLIVAHRLSAVEQADWVFVFEKGHLVQQGEPNELLQQKGVYARLYGDAAQAAS